MPDHSTEIGGARMSNGGLLEKAKEQQMVDEVVAEAVPSAVVSAQGSDVGICLLYTSPSPRD